MGGLDYLDFDLLIERAPTGTAADYRARVLRSPAGEAAAPVTLSAADHQLKALLSQVSAYPSATGVSIEPAARDLGGLLYRAVFGGDIGAALRASLEAADTQNMGLRVRLRLADVPELIGLPWEFLYHPGLHRFLALSDRTPLVRYLDLPEQIQPLRAALPLRILVMLSSPRDYPALDIEAEWEGLNSALADLVARGLVAIERLENASLPALQRRLRRGEYHLFHYVGHGGFDEASQDGILLLEDENRQGSAASGRHLGTLLHDHRSLRLVVLNACSGAATSVVEPFAGTAQSLVAQGLPAVIAMGFAISDRAARVFATEFYASIADGYPVDAAVAETRKAILLGGGTAEWAAPVLYMRSPGGHIFDFTPSGGASANEQPQQGKLSELREALARHRLVLFVGADLPESVTGVPSRQVLADALAARHGIEPGLRLASVAQQTMRAGSRFGFTDYIRTRLETAGKVPGAFYRSIVGLVRSRDVQTIITTAYDNLLQLAFQDAGTALNVVVRPGDVAFIAFDRPTLIRLYGDRNQPDTLIVTEQDQHALLRDWKNPLLGEIQSAMRRNSILFLGYDLDDPVLGALFDEVAGDRFQMRSYAVWSGLSPQQRDSLQSNRNLVVLDTDPVALLQSLSSG